jgi:uncharacterized protein (DUF1499 family)
MLRPIAVLAVAVLTSLALLACAGKAPPDVGVAGSRLAPCPDSPNCVSSDAADEEHAIAPFALAKPALKAWRAAVDAVAALPRVRIVVERVGYLHAECRSAVFGFVDDLELQLRAGDGVIAVRSASRLGHSDLGVNRRRVEALRAELVAGGAIR